MIYRVEVWQYHSMVEAFESEKAEKINEYIQSNWALIFEDGGCMIYVYKNGNNLELEQMEKDGIYCFHSNILK